MLDDGRVLGTQISHSDDKIASSGVFGEILRTQHEVSQAELWECIRTGTPVERPISVDPAPVERAMYVIRVLTGELHMTSEEIAELSAEEAIEIVNKHWAGG